MNSRDGTEHVFFKHWDKEGPEQNGVCLRACSNKFCHSRWSLAGGFDRSEFEQTSFGP